MRDFVVLCGSTLALWSGFFLLLGVVPGYAVERLGCNESQLGLISSAMTITAMGARPWAGYAVDRWGRRWVHVGSLVVFAGALYGYGLVGGLATLLLLRVLMGLPFAFTTTASLTVAADLVPAARRGEGLGYFGLVGPLAMAVAPAAGMWLLGDGRYTLVFGTAAGLLLCAAAVALAIRHPPVRAADALPSLGDMLEKRVLGIGLVVLLIEAGWGSVVVFVPLYAAQLGMANAGLFYTLYSAGALISRPVAGRVFDRHGARPVFGLGLGLLLAAYAILIGWETAAGLLSAASVMGLGLGALGLSLQAMAVNAVPAARRGAASATFNAAFDLGIGVGTSLLGAVAHATGSYATMYLTAAGMAVISAVLFFAVVMPRYEVVRERGAQDPVRITRECDR